MQQDQQPSRLLYLDNLRAFAMIVGVFFHAALAYSPMAYSLWPSANPEQHWAFDLFAWASHLFRMPLFFLLAGFFTALLLAKQGWKTFFNNRMYRIALPLLLFLPLLTVLVGFVVQFGIGYVEQKPPFLQFIQSFLSQAEPTAMPLSTMHLWFLYHLLFLYLLTWCGKTLISERLMLWLLQLPVNLLLLLLILAAIPALFAVSVPFPAPEWIFPALWALWFYGLFFALGLAIFQKPALLQQMDPHRLFYVLIGGISYGFYYACFPTSLLPETQPQGLLKFCLTVFEAISAVLWTIATLLYARRWFNFSHRFLRYLSQVSYWVYLVHLPLLFFLQFLLTDLSLPLLVKFLLSSVGTIALCLLSFHLLVSWNGLAKMVGGRQQQQS